MRASLPMYNLPEMRAENAAFWQALRTELTRRGLDGLPETPEFDRPPVPGAIEPDTLSPRSAAGPCRPSMPGRHLRRLGGLRLLLPASAATQRIDAGAGAGAGAAEPGHPFVTAGATPKRVVALLQEALFAVARAPKWAAARAGLLLADILPPEPGRHAVQQAYVTEAAALGYPALAWVAAIPSGR